MLGTRSMTLSSELECDLDRNLRAGDVEVLLALEVKVPPSDKCGQKFLIMLMGAQPKVQAKHAERLHKSSIICMLHFLNDDQN